MTRIEYKVVIDYPCIYEIIFKPLGCTVVRRNGYFIIFPCSAIITEKESSNVCDIYTHSFEKI